MRTKKAVVIGIDALEYDLVEKWNLKNLKQVEYGKTVLPIRRDDGYFYFEPATPIMWTSFITGMPPRIHGIDTVSVYKFPFNILFKKILFEWFEIERKPRPPHYKGKMGYGWREVYDIISHAMNKIHLKRKPIREDIKTDTIFDIVKPSIALHIPVYCKDAFPLYEKKIVEAIENKAYKPIFELSALSEFRKRRNEVFRWLNKNEWKLFMQYFYALDGIQHVFYNNPKKIAKFYIMFDEFMRDIKSKIDDDTFFLIVSDHGQNRGIHTNHGFYSVNKPLGLKNPKFIDFRWIIQDYLTGGNINEL